MFHRLNKGIELVEILEETTFPQGGYSSNP